MKLDFQYGGLDDVLKMITQDLRAALNTKKTSRKHELIYHALGAVDTLWNLTVEVDESENTSEDNNLE